MKKDIVCVAIMLCGLAGGSWATETNSSLAPLTAPVVLAQAADSGSTVTQPDYLLQACAETTSAGDPASAFRSVDPAYMLKNYIQSRDHHLVRVESITNVALLEGTMHGKITSVIDNTGRSWYRYDPPSNYVGNDQAVFMAEYEGKVYKIVLELHVFTWVNEKIPSSCPPPQLIKVNGKPASGSSSLDLNSIPVTFADFTGAAVGQTGSTGITLDTTAAGNGWFIDTTPADNSEFLPTSNPNEWVAGVKGARLDLSFSQPNLKNKSHE